MLSSEAGEIIARHRGDAPVVVTMTTIFTFPESDTDDLVVRCAPLMGGASSIGLGLALAVPTRKVLVLDGDGSLLMQLGTLATIASAGADNLYHFVFHNRVLYEGGGRVPIAAPDVDFVAMALAAGYAAAETISDPAVLETRLPAILQQRGPVLIHLEVELPASPGWSSANPHGELPDWWFEQMGDDGRQVARTLAAARDESVARSGAPESV
ncbi:MAG: thiamine pyrophosphate-dependent enzyme [Candidatus Dormibacteria bacterium]